MTQYFTDFSQYAIDEIPSDWSSAYVSGGVLAHKIIDGGAKGRVLEIRSTSAAARKLLGWDAVAATTEVNILMLGRAVGGGDVAVASRIDGAAADYIAAGQIANATRSREYDNNVEVDGTFNSGFHGTNWVWIEVSIIGNEHKVRVWPELDPVPTWDGTLTLTAALAAGDVGAYIFAAGGIVEIAQFAVGTNGDAAPTGASDTTPPSYEVAPAETETRENGHTISATLNEDGTIYGVRLPAGATVPTSQQVIDGQDASGSPALEADSVVASAGISADLDFVTASAGIGYRYAIVAVDDEPTPNVQATPTVIDDTTATAVVEGISAQTIRDKAGDLTPNATNLKIAVRASSDPESVVHFSTTTGSLNGSSQTAAINLGSAGVTVGDTVHFSYFNPALNEGLNVDLTVEDIA